MVFCLLETAVRLLPDQSWQQSRSVTGTAGEMAVLANGTVRLQQRPVVESIESGEF